MFRATDSGQRRDSKAPHAASFDEAKANPYPNLPGRLTAQGRTEGDFGEDLADFEIIPVLTSAEARAKVGGR